MHVVDSSGWLEYFANGENADFFAEPLADTPALIVPAISIFEAFKRLLMQRDEASALQAAALIQAGKVVPLDESLAMTAAKLSCELKLPLSDSFMLGTARQFEAVLWTQDADFWGVPGVCCVAKVAGC